MRAAALVILVGGCFVACTDAEEREPLGMSGDAGPASVRPDSMPSMRPMPDDPLAPWMRRVTVRVGDVQGGSDPSRNERDAVERARQSLALDRNSRDRHRNLVRALAITGEVDEAAVVATQWWERDRLDAEALARLADAEARRGHRDRAIRLAASTIDVRADDVSLQERMARLYERADQRDIACGHRIALAELQPSSADALGTALRCLRALGRTAEADHLATTIVDDAIRTRAEQIASRAAASSDNVRGDIVAEASWDAPSDLDVSIITPRGTRASWMGGLGTITARDAISTSNESVGVSRMGNGRYAIEIVRPDSVDPSLPISGRVVIRALGERRTFPFTLTGQRSIVGHATIRSESRMVQASW